MSGFYLNTSSTTTSQCVSCPTGCSTCSSKANCLTCSSGYTLQSNTVSGTAGTCVICASPCSTCSGNSFTCTSCITGFKLVGWQCISTFNFQFFISLNTNLTNFYDRYFNFLQALTAPLGTQDVSAISIGSIVSGSVNVTGSISTTAQSGSNDASSQYYGV